MTTRRNFLKTTAALPVAALWPRQTPRLAFAPARVAPRGDVLVYVFLRGAADSLNIVIPHGERAYYQNRPTIAIPRPDDARATRAQRALNLDDFFGLHPAMASLLPMWQAKHLALVHAVGAPDESRSHFQATALIERGVDNAGGPASGWLGRHLGALDTGNHSPLRGVSIGEAVTQALQGPIPVTALRSIANYHLNGNPRAIAKMQAALNVLYTAGDPLDIAAQEAMRTLKAINTLNPSAYRPAGNAVYPDDDFGRGLKQVAMLVKAEVGLEAACLDVENWDTHIAQGGSEGWMATLLRSLAEGLSAFYLDMKERAQQLTIVVMSEFGRRVKENGGLGTDHGHGGAMLLLGGNVAGGKVYGQWPGLEPEHLVGPGDLAVTTDYRDVLAEIILKRLNNPHLDAIFPNYTPVFRGVVSS